MDAQELLAYRTYRLLSQAATRGPENLTTLQCHGKRLEPAHFRLRNPRPGRGHPFIHPGRGLVNPQRHDRSRSPTRYSAGSCTAPGGSLPSRISAVNSSPSATFATSMRVLRGPSGRKVSTGSERLGCRFPVIIVLLFFLH